MTMKIELADSSKDILREMEVSGEDWGWFAGGLILGGCCCA